MKDESFPLLLWRDLRAAEPNLLPRGAVSIVAGLVLPALAVVGAWGFAQSSDRAWVPAEYLLVAVSLAAACWFVLLILIWRPMRHGGQLVVPAIGTIGIGVTALVGMFAIDEVLRIRDEGLLMGAVLLMGCAGVIAVWLPTVQRLRRGRPVVGPDNLVRVNCPQCGYSLIGLRDLRCPECGTGFTIDGLIRAQGYGGVEKVSAGEGEGRSAPRARRAGGNEGWEGRELGAAAGE